MILFSPSPPISPFFDIFLTGFLFGCGSAALYYNGSNCSQTAMNLGILLWIAGFEVE
jgi:hypothetical protein